MKCAASLLVTMSLTTTVAGGHWMWVETAGGRAHFYFGAFPDYKTEGKALYFIAKTSAWALLPDGDQRSIPLAPIAGRWDAAMPSSAHGVVGYCDCDVFASAGEPGLLQYSAKAVFGPANKYPGSASGRLPLEFVTEAAVPDLRWGGKEQIRLISSLLKTGGVEIIAWDAKSAGDREEPPQDAIRTRTAPNGAFLFKPTRAGEWIVYARIDVPAAGEKDGKRYTQVIHISTLHVTVR